MFMVRDEYTNTKNLLKVKTKLLGRGLKWFFIAASIIFAGSIIPTISSIATYTVSGAVGYSITDYSNMFFIGILIAYIVIMIMYRQENNKLAVFPQTNTSRYVSSLIVNYIMTFVVMLTALAMYLIYYGAIKLVSLFKENIYFVLDFNTSFLLTGLFTHIVYALIILAIIELVGSLVRKWFLYTLLALTAVISAAIWFIGLELDIVGKLLGFLTNEPSIILFFVKCFGIWLVFTAVTLLLNKYTIYHKTHNIRKGLTVIICVLIALVFFIVLPAIAIYTTRNVNTTRLEAQTVASNREDIYINEREAIMAEAMYYTDAHNSRLTEIRLDISHLEKGSEIKFVGENIYSNYYNVDGSPRINFEVTWAQNNLPAFIDGLENLESIDGDTLVIAFRTPFTYMNGVELAGYSKPNISYNLDGDTIYIQYNIESAQVIIMPIWGIANQFDHFKGSGVLPTTPTPWGYTSGGFSNASIGLYIE